MKSGTITVADASNNRILFISPQGQVVGQIGNGADAHDPPVSIAYPNGDTPLADGDVLVSEINGSWVDEYTPTGKLVWTVHIPTVNYPSDPQQIGSDRYLMTDYDPRPRAAILEFTRQGTVTWLYDVTAGDAHAEEAVPGGATAQRADHGQRRLPRPGGGHRPDHVLDRLAVRAHRCAGYCTRVAVHPGRLRQPSLERHDADPPGHRMKSVMSGMDSMRTPWSGRCDTRLRSRRSSPATVATMRRFCYLADRGMR